MERQNDDFLGHHIVIPEGGLTVVHQTGVPEWLTLVSRFPLKNGPGSCTWSFQTPWIHRGHYSS